MQRFLTSPECFVLDRDGVVALRTIDLGKFNENRLNNCYKISNEKLLAFRLNLISKTKPIGRTIKTSNWIESISPSQKISHDVLIFSDPELINGELEIEIQTRQ